MSEICVTSKKNISLAKCIGNYGVITGFYAQEDLDDEGYSYSNALLEATWIEAINKAEGDRLYVPCPKARADVYTWSGDESQRTRTTTGKNQQTRKGYTEFSLTYNNLTVSQYNRLATFDGQTMRVFPYTINGDIFGYDTGTNVRGMKADIFVSNFVPAETNEAQSSVIVTVSIHETNSPITYVVPANEMDFDPEDVQGIIDVLLTMVSSSAVSNELVFTAVTVPDGAEVSELITATDFSLGIGTVSSITVSGNTYTAVTADTVAGSTTLELINQPDMDIKGFETESAVDITIGA